MKFAPRILVALALIVLLSPAGELTAQSAYTLSPDSKFWVSGTSTLHDWDCKATQSSGSVALSWADGAPEITGASVVVPTDGMDCDNGTMNKKLREALKLESTPNVLFELERAAVSTTAPADSFEIATEGYFAIAGQTRKIELIQFATSSGEGAVRFRGSFNMLLEDYQIKRPSALLGTIKTGNEVTIHFDIRAIQLDSGDES